jgi:thiamine-phosphate pyrophosphorylase
VTRRFAPPPLYPIVDVHSASSEEISRAFALAVTLAEAGARVLQLRAKTLSAGPMTTLSARIREAIATSGSTLLVNDRADVAAASGAAGVHLGDEDVPPAVARACLGDDAIVGFSTHSLDDVARASGLPVDYIGFGPVFESPTKAGVRSPRGVAALANAAAASRLPVIAIGGVTLDTAPVLWRAGAASVAVISELERAADPAELVRSYLRAARGNK